MYSTPRWCQFVLWSVICLGIGLGLSAVARADSSDAICEPDKFIATLTLALTMPCPSDLAEGGTCLLLTGDDPDVGYVAIVWNDILMAIVQMKSDGSHEFIYQAIHITIEHAEEPVDPAKCEALCA